MKDFFTLLVINLKTKFYNFIEYLKVIKRYYSDFHFFKIDSRLLISYLFSNPFRISKKFLRSKGIDDLYTYGETPLTTIDRISQECTIQPGDVLVELGCGRGRACFWLNHFIGCTVIGIDFVPAFIEKANKVKEQFHLNTLFFRCEDLFQTNLKGASVIYLYGTCFSSDEIEALIEKFQSLSDEIKIITVSYPLTDFQKKEVFEVIKEFPASFTWGETEVYVHQKKKSHSNNLSYKNDSKEFKL